MVYEHTEDLDIGIDKKKEIMIIGLEEEEGFNEKDAIVKNIMTNNPDRFSSVVPKELQIQLKEKEEVINLEENRSNYPKDIYLRG